MIIHYLFIYLFISIAKKYIAYRSIHRNMKSTYFEPGSAVTNMEVNLQTWESAGSGCVWPGTFPWPSCGVNGSNAGPSQVYPGFSVRKGYYSIINFTAVREVMDASHFPNSAYCKYSTQEHHRRKMDMSFQMCLLGIRVKCYFSSTLSVKPTAGHLVLS